MPHKLDHLLLHQGVVILWALTALLTVTSQPAIAQSDNDYSVINWIGSHPVLSMHYGSVKQTGEEDFGAGPHTRELLRVGRRRVIVLADEITLHSDQISRSLYSCPEDLMIVADTLYLTGRFSVDLNATVDHRPAIAEIKPLQERAEILERKRAALNEEAQQARAKTDGTERANAIKAVNEKINAFNGESDTLAKDWSAFEKKHKIAGAIGRLYKDGGNLTILARRFVCENDPYSVDSGVKAYFRDHPDHLGPPFLRPRISFSGLPWQDVLAARMKLQEEERKLLGKPLFEVDWPKGEGKSGRGLIASELIEVPGVDPKNTEASRREFIEKYCVGCKVSNRPWDLAKSEVPMEELHRWGALRLADIRADAVTAVQRQDFVASYLAFKKYARIPRVAIGQSALALAEKLNEMREKHLPPVIYRRFDALGRGVDTFVQQPDFRCRMGPTDALLITRQVSGRQVAGISYRNPEKLTEVTLFFQAQLRTDSRLRQFVRTELAKTQEEAAEGVFGDWDIVARTPQTPGVRSFSATVIENTLWCTLSLDVNQAIQARAWLTSPEGMPLIFDWNSRRDPKVRGTLSLSLSLARRMGADKEVRVVNGKLHNDCEMTDVVVRYVQAGDEYISLQPALKVRAKQSADIPLPNAKKVTARVPAEAVDYDLDIEKVFGEFAEAPREKIETVEVVNQFDLVDPRWGREPGDLPTATMDHVEVTISYGRDDDPERQEIGPVRLGTQGSTAARLENMFVQRGTGRRTVTVKGTAYYGPGGQTGEARFETSSTSLRVVLTQNLLPKIPANSR